LEIPNLAGEDEDTGFETGLKKRSKLILNWQTICALLVVCGTVRLTAAQFETLRCFSNWSSSSINHFKDLIPIYSTLKAVLVRCIRKYCWAKSTILRFPVASERSKVKSGVKDGTLAPHRVVIQSSWARLDVATSTVLERLSGSRSAISSYHPIPLFSSIEDSPIVQNRAKHTNVLEYAFVEILETDSSTLRLPISLQEDDRVFISLQCTQKSVQFLREHMFFEGKRERTLRLSVTRVTGILGVPLIIGYGAERASPTGDCMV
jgi:hypothetical protein